MHDRWQAFSTKLKALKYCNGVRTYKNNTTHCVCQCTLSVSSAGYNSVNLKFTINFSRKLIII